MSLTYPPEPSGHHAVAVVWDCHGGVQLAKRPVYSMRWAVTGDDQLFYWDELMHKIALHAENPQATIDSVRVVDIPASPKFAAPVEPPQTGKLVVAQLGTVCAVRQAHTSIWATTEGDGYFYTWPALMARVFETTGYASWKVLS